MKDRLFLKSVKICADIIWNSNRRLRFFFILAIVLDLLVVGLSVAAPGVLKKLIDSYSMGTPGKTLVLIGLAYGLVWLASELFVRIKAVIGVDVIEEVKRQSSARLCQNLIFPSNGDSENISSGVFATRLNQVGGAIPIFVDGLAGQVFPLIARLGISVLILIQFVPLIYSIALIIVVFAFAAVSILAFRYIGERQRQSNSTTQGAFGLMLDILTNRELISVHAEEQQEMGNINNALKDAKKAMVGAVYIQQLSSGVQIILLGAGLGVITALAAHDLSNSVITIGEFVQINAYLLQFVLPVSYFGMVISGIKRASVTLSENVPYLSEKCRSPRIRNIANRKTAPSIELFNVCIKGDTDNLILKNISFSLEPGLSLAIVGPSGAGKTTLLKTILGLHSPSNGSISVKFAGIQYEDITSIRNQLGYAPQESLLLNRNIYENIACGRDISNGAVLQYLSDSGLDLSSEIELSEKPIGSLSGGEKQRISIARVLARGVPLMVFDEPAASLDVDAKRSIDKLLYEKLPNITKVIVTHDLNQASKADKILVMAEGKILQAGNHAYLISCSGWYRTQWLQSALDEPSTV